MTIMCSESWCRYTIEIVALREESRHYVIEVSRPGLKPRQYACGPNNSIGNTIARICNQLELDPD